MDLPSLTKDFFIILTLTLARLTEKIDSDFKTCSLEMLEMLGYTEFDSNRIKIYMDSLEGQLCQEFHWKLQSITPFNYLETFLSKNDMDYKRAQWFCSLGIFIPLYFSHSPLTLALASMHAASVVIDFSDDVDMKLIKEISSSLRKTNRQLHLNRNRYEHFIQFLTERIGFIVI
jgi:hypothetical protein